MKTKTLNYLKATLVAILFLTTNMVKSQIAWPYPVTNSLTCDVRICYEFHDDHMCTFVCIPCPIGGIVVKAGTTVNIGGTICNNGFVLLTPMSDVHIAIMEVDGVTPSSSCREVGDPSTCINSCGGVSITNMTVPAPSNCGNVNITYSASGTLIN